MELKEDRHWSVLPQRQQDATDRRPRPVVEGRPAGEPLPGTDGGTAPQTRRGVHVTTLSEDFSRLPRPGFRGLPPGEVLGTRGGPPEPRGGVSNPSRQLGQEPPRWTADRSSLRPPHWPPPPSLTPSRK